MKILIVDDIEQNLYMLQVLLEGHGYEVVSAGDGTEALEVARRDPPGMNGVELYRAVKAQWPGLPFILMTAYSADSLVQEGLKEGAIAALTKPLNIEELLVLLALVCDQEFAEESAR